MTNTNNFNFVDFIQSGGKSTQEPLDKNLYNYVKQLANKKFKSNRGVYRSSWIVREYLNRGGKYKTSKPKKSNTGLRRWYKEKWIDLNRPIRNSKGKIISYKSCGRSKVKGSKDKYPLCRPSKRITSKSPRTYKEISKKSISKAKRDKSKVKHKKNIKFGSGNKETIRKETRLKLKEMIKKRIKSNDNKYNTSKIKKTKDIKPPRSVDEIFKEIEEGKIKKPPPRHMYERTYLQLSPQKYMSESEFENAQQRIREMFPPKYEWMTKVDNQTQNGGFYGDPKLKYQLLLNILKRRTCPYCNTIILDNFNEHVIRHELKSPLKKRKFQYFEFFNRQSGSGTHFSQYRGRKSKVMVKVPENVKKVAEYSFKLRKLGFKGGLETGWKRAKQLATKNEIPIQDLRFMRAWFARHIYTSYPSYKQWKKAGRPKNDTYWHNKRGIISWLIWGGTPALKWVNSQKNINLLNNYYPNKNYKKLNIPKN